ELGRAHPLVEEGGSDEVLSRDQAIEPEYLAGWPRDRAGPKRIMEGPIFLEDRVHDRIGTRRDRIKCTGATVQGEQANLRRPHGIGKPGQHDRPESFVEHGLVDQIYHGLKVIFLGHGKGLGRKGVCKRRGYRFALITRLRTCTWRIAHASGLVVIATDDARKKSVKILEIQAQAGEPGKAVSKNRRMSSVWRVVPVF